MPDISSKYSARLVLVLFVVLCTETQITSVQWCCLAINRWSTEDKLRIGTDGLVSDCIYALYDRFTRSGMNHNRVDNY